jgi:hypothetical protein
MLEGAPVAMEEEIGGRVMVLVDVVDFNIPLNVFIFSYHNEAEFFEIGDGVE